MFVRYAPHDTGYSVTLKTDCKKSMKEEMHQLQYDIEVKTIQQELDYRFIEVTKTNMVWNGQDTNEAFHNVFLLTIKALDRVVIKTDIAGNALGLSNHPEILQKWAKSKEEAREMYAGQNIHEYLDEMEQQLSTPESAWEMLRRNFFYTVYFNGLYQDYGLTKTIQEPIRLFDLFPHQAVDSILSKTIQPDQVGWIVKSKLSDCVKNYSRDTLTFLSPQDESSLQPADLQAEGFYKLDGLNGEIIEAEMNAVLEIKGLYTKKMWIHLKEWA